VVGINPVDSEKHDTIIVTKYVQIASTAKLKAAWPPDQDADIEKRDKGAEWAVVTTYKRPSGITGGQDAADVKKPLLPADTKVTVEAQASTDKKILNVRKTSPRVPKP
jgi:hypothetical protein